ncbi:MAG TPA: hypothetical protein VH475_15515, partial [Tepidisphaeraceae bacterium]
MDDNPTQPQAPAEVQPQSAIGNPQSAILTPLSETRLAANRANALRSTGPKTPEGKARSALNALTHGLRARLDRATLVPATERDEFALFLEDFRRHLDPQSPLEDLLVERIALLGWKLRRHAQAEARLFDAPYDEALAKHEQQLEHNRRYRVRDQPPPAPAPRAAGDLLAQFVRTAAENNVDVIGTLLRYDTTTQRAFTQALHQYRLLHATPADPPAQPANTDLHHHFHYHHHAPANEHPAATEIHPSPPHLLI